MISRIGRVHIDNRISPLTNECKQSKSSLVTSMPPSQTVVSIESPVDAYAQTLGYVRTAVIYVKRYMTKSLNR